jgi:hypothetical protein
MIEHDSCIQVAMTNISDDLEASKKQIAEMVSRTNGERGESRWLCYDSDIISAVRAD